MQTENTKTVQEARQATIGAAVDRIGHQGAGAIAKVATWLVSLRRELVRFEPDVVERQRYGVAEGQLLPASFIYRMHRLSQLRVDVWCDEQDGDEHRLNVHVLGHHIEVWYRPKSWQAQAAHG